MSLTIEEVAHPGHFICSHLCRYTRYTQVTLGDKGYRVSTVGEMYYTQDVVDVFEKIERERPKKKGKIREVVKEMNDPTSPWFRPPPREMQTLGYGSSDGGPAYYEVAVFPTSGEKDSDEDCPCRKVTSWSGSEMLRFSTKLGAQMKHEELVEEYGTKLLREVTDAFDPSLSTPHG